MEVSIVSNAASALTGENKQRMLLLFQEEKATWPSASLVKLEKDLGSALLVAIAWSTPSQESKNEHSVPTSTLPDGEIRSDEIGKSTCSQDMNETVPSDSLTKSSPTKEIIGFAIVSGVSNDPLLEHIVVTKSKRGGGIGRALIQAILQVEPIVSAPTLDCYCLCGVGKSQAHVSSQLIPTNTLISPLIPSLNSLSLSPSAHIYHLAPTLYHMSSTLL